MGYSKLTYDDWVEHPGVWGFAPPKWASNFSSKGYKSISAIDFYDDIFGEDLEVSRMPEDYQTGEYAGIAVEKVPQFYPSGLPKLDKKGKQKYSRKTIKTYQEVDKAARTIFRG